MIAGTLCGLISTLTTSVCKEYYQFILSQGILFGLGVGLLYVQQPSQAHITPDWYF